MAQQLINEIAPSLAYTTLRRRSVNDFCAAESRPLPRIFHISSGAHTLGRLSDLLLFFIPTRVQLSPSLSVYPSIYVAVSASIYQSVFPFLLLSPSYSPECVPPLDTANQPKCRRVLYRVSIFVSLILVSAYTWVMDGFGNSFTFTLALLIRLLRNRRSRY